jgi:hypothetical protein
MSKKDKQMKEFHKELKEISQDIRSVKYITELEYQCNRLDDLGDRIEQYITGHGTGFHDKKD